MTAASLLLDTVRAGFRAQRRHAERAAAQVDDEAFFRALDPGSNSIAVIMKHVAGNLRSRWTDFLTTDGEKPDRDRDGEFEIRPGDTRAAIMARWDEGWAIALASLDSLTEADLGGTVLIRGERFGVAEAILRGLTHSAGHAGQIVLLAKHLAGDRWQTLSIPRRSTDGPPEGGPHDAKKGRGA